MTTNNKLRSMLGAFFSVLFLWLIFRQINFEEIKQAFVGAKLIWIIAALAAFILGYSCRIERWRLMLERENPHLHWGSCAGPFLASFAANNILPLRAGDGLRSFAFNRELGTTPGVVIATLFVERLLDLLIVLVLLGTALAILELETKRFAGLGLAVIIASAAAILVALLFPHLFKPSALALGRIVARFAPDFGRKLLDEVNKSLNTLQHLAQGNTMMKLISWSMMGWLAEGCVFWFAALALPSIFEPLAAWLALPGATLATLIPSTPGYVGTFDFFTVRAMTALGNTSGAATAYALVVHVLLWLPPTLAGGFYLILHPRQTTTKLNRS